MAIDWKVEVERRLQETIRVREILIREHVGHIVQLGEWMAECLEGGGTVLLCGNGGSAADSQHIAAELVGRFHAERKGLPAIALTTDTSALTALANDYGYERVFARQVEALGRRGDLFVGISTSGNSPNVLSGAAEAHQRGLRTVGLTGAKGGKLRSCVDLWIGVPSDETPRIQEMHITIGHIACEIAERSFVGK